MVDMVKMGTGWFQADSYIPFSFTDSGVGGGGQGGEGEGGAVPKSALELSGASHPANHPLSSLIWWGWSGRFKMLPGEKAADRNNS